MKTGKFIWLFFAMLLGVTTLFAQGWGYGNRPGYGAGFGYGAGPGFGYGAGPCYNFAYSIPGITEEQKTQINELQVNHQKAMVELVIKQRSTYDLAESNAIREEILKMTLAHRDNIRGLLTEEQQEQFDLMQSRYGFGMGFGPGRRGGRGRGGFGAWGGGPRANCPYFYGGRGYMGAW
jgi:hypothetical protein